ncbi:MAG: hypothetical protein IKM49_05945 [Ruminococcus sp.]|nr:hypothetical protein [Ruminococcus sp.]
MFVCHGNICRSPMAEFIMKKLVSDMGYNDKVYIFGSDKDSKIYKLLTF